MDRRSLLAISLCLLIWLGWQKYFMPQPQMMPQQAQSLARQNRTGTPGANLEAHAPDMRDERATSGNANGNPSGNTTAGNAAPSNKSAAKRELKTLQTGTGAVTLSSGGPIINDWKLKGYKLGLAADAQAVDLEATTNTAGEIELAFDDSSLAYLNGVQGTFSDTPNGLQWKYEDQNVSMTRDFAAEERSNTLDAKFTVTFKNKAPRFAFLSLTSQTLEKDPEERDRQLLLWSNQSLDRVASKKASLKEITTPVKYVGAQSRYFLLAMLNESPVEAKGLVQQIDPYTGRASLVYPVAGNSITIPVRIYYGPKELDLIRSVDPALDSTVDFGWFTIFAYPILKLLRWLYTFIHNYGTSIIVLTVLLKIATYPLAYKSTKSMKEMAKIQPQLARVREKYKDDKEALNREMMSLMKNHGYNPVAGCLPILIQMPIFFALYRVLYSSIELYHAPFYGWIHDLSFHDPFYVTPIAMSLLMFLQQRLQPNPTADPAQAKMMQLMPLMFGAFMLALPAGLTLYMLTNSLASIVQQIILNKKLGITPGGGAGGKPQPA